MFLTNGGVWLADVKLALHELALTISCLFSFSVRPYHFLLALPAGRSATVTRQQNGVSLVDEKLIPNRWNLKKYQIKKLKLKLDKVFVEFSQFSHFSQDTRVSDCVPRWVEHDTVRKGKANRHMTFGAAILASGSSLNS